MGRPELTMNPHILPSRLTRIASRLWGDRRGNVAILFGVSLLPLAALVGVALDMNRAIEFRTVMQRESDMAALSIASAESPNTDAVLGALKARLAAYYGSSSTMVGSIAASSQWTGGAYVSVTTSASLATTLSGILPGNTKSLALSVASTAKRKPAEWQWSLPTIKDLSYEAADYNRISVYCYDESKKTEANNGRRLETLTAISDNGGTDYSKAKLPSCLAGETLSYQLRNVRNSRTTKTNWDKASVEHYLYFTDTTIDPNTRVAKQNVSGGRENSYGTITAVDVANPPILETILCTTLVDCKSKSLGGLLPNDNVGSHDPVTATGGCSESKSMYFGWEDRPPSAGGSDKDYNDIRILVSCPTLVKIADKEVRIVQ